MIHYAKSAIIKIEGDAEKRGGAAALNDLSAHTKTRG
jgi:hypothetical protein